MRYVALLVALAPMLTDAADVGRLWDFVDRAPGHPAPVAIQAALSARERINLRTCRTEQRMSSAQMASYFAAYPIDLGGRTQGAYLVVPSYPCGAFFGAHAVQFWIVDLVPGGGVSVLLTGQQDALEVEVARSHGLRDIRVRYNDESSYFRYDGASYQKERQ